MKKTYAVIAIAAALMSDADAHHWGYELSRESGIRSGVMYPVLQRMLNEGWLADGWENPAEQGRGKRPPRRYYHLTAEGKADLADLLAQARDDARYARLVTR